MDTIIVLEMIEGIGIGTADVMAEALMVVIVIVTIATVGGVRRGIMIDIMTEMIAAIEIDIEMVTVDGTEIMIIGEDKLHIMMIILIIVLAVFLKGKVIVYKIVQKKKK